MKKIEDFKNRKTARKWFGGTTGVYYYAVLIDFRVPWSTPTWPQNRPSSMAVGKTDPAKNTPKQENMVCERGFRGCAHGRHTKTNQKGPPRNL